MSEYLGTALLELNATAAPLRRTMTMAERDVQASLNRMNTQAGRGLASFSSRMNNFGRAMTHGFTYPILGIAGATAKMAADFDRAMEMIHTQAGAPQREVDKLRVKVLQLAKSMPQTPQELAGGLFHLESIGLRDAKAMDALKVAAQGAAVGHADLEQTATALGSAWLVNIKGGGDLRQVMAMLNATVGAGNMRMQDLVDALGTGVLPASKLAGLGIRDVMGALAVLTDEGYAASSAAAQFATALHFLYNPTQKAEVALSHIGLSGAKLAADMHKPEGLLVTFRDLSEHLDRLPGGRRGVKAEQLLGDIFPAGRGRVMLTLLNQMDRYQMKLKQISRGQAQFGDDIRKTMDQPAVRVQRAWAGLSSELIKFGQDVLPPLMNAGMKVVGFAEHAAHAFTRLPPGMQRAIITGGFILAGIGPAMRIIGAFSGLIARLTGPFMFAARLAAGRGFSAALGRAASTATSTGRIAATMEVADMAVGTLVARSMVGGGVGRIGVGRSVAGTSTSVVSTTGRRVAAAEVAAGETATAASMASRAGGAAMRVLGAVGVAAFLAPLAFGMTKVIGGWINDQAMAEGRKFADKFLAPFPKTVRDRFREPLAQAHRDVQAAQQAVTERRGALSRGGRVPAGMAGPTPAEQRRSFNAYFQEGFKGGNAFIAGMRTVKFPTTIGFERSMIASLRNMDPQARQQAAKMMLGFAASLEKNGKLPKGATNQLIKGIQRQFPDLLTYLGRVGLNSDKALALHMKFNQSTKHIVSALNDWQNKFGEFNVVVDQSGKNWESTTSYAMKRLRNTMRHGTHDARIAAKAELDKLQANVNDRFDAMLGQVNNSTNQMKNSIQRNFHGSRQAAADNLQKFNQNVQHAMAAGVITSDKGARLMTEATNNTLRNFGAKPLPLPKSVSTSGLSAPGAGLHGGMVAARGALLTIGREGERGVDNVPIDVFGRRIRAGRGEKIAILNADQQREADIAFAYRGGFDGLFSSGRDHYATPRFAAGGVASGSSGSPPNLYGHPSNIVPALARLIATMEQHFPDLTVTATTDGSHVSSSYHYRGEAVDMVSSIPRMFQASEWIKASGLYRSLTEGIHNPNLAVNAGQLVDGPSFYSSVWAGHADHIHMAVTGALGPFAQALAIQLLKEPIVKGDGTVSNEVRGAMKKITKAANDYIQKHQPQVGSMAGMPTGPLTGSVEKQVFEFFSRAGMSKIGIAGMLGNAAQESGMNPSTPGGGLWQMISTFGSGAPPLVEQMQSLLSQIRGTSLWGAMNSAKTPGEAAILFEQQFEKPDPALANMPRRIAAAQAAYAAGYAGGGRFSPDRKLKAAPKRGGSSVSNRTLEELGSVGKKVASLETDLTNKLAQYEGLSGRFGTEEQSAQYLNADGSMNSAGVAKKTQDDEILLGLERQIYDDYSKELKPVSWALRRFLGKRAKTENTITKLGKQLNKNSNKETGIREALTALNKPKKDSVSPIEDAIHAVRDHYRPLLAKARKARDSYHGGDSKHRHGLQDAVRNLEGQEQSALGSLEGQLHSAESNKKKDARKVKAARFKLDVQLRKLLDEDKQLRHRQSTLKGILTGSGGAQGTNTTISALESVADKLGTVEWGRDGKFLRINTKNQGAAYDAYSTILQLENVVGQDKSTPTTVAPDQSAQIDLLNQLVQQQAAELGVSRAQYQVLSQLPPFGGFFAAGGVVPGAIGEARTIVAHGGERVSKAGDGGAPTVHVVVQDGAVDPNKIQVIAEGATVKILNKTAAKARPLAGRTGGLYRS